MKMRSKYLRGLVTAKKKERTVQIFEGLAISSRISLRTGKPDDINLALL
jgi:predicted Zn-dependent protease with MMP-like domain